MSVQTLLKETEAERGKAYDSYLTAKQKYQDAEKALRDAEWEMQMVVSKIGILIDQLPDA